MDKKQKKEDQETLHVTKDNAVIRVVQDKYDGRRKFEVVQAPDNPEELAQEKEKETPRTLKNLEGRSTNLNLDAQVGKVQMIQKDSATGASSGFYCKHCEALMKDSNAWLDHINGVKHNKALGMNMKVERVGVDKVRERLQGLKKATSGQPITSMEDFEKKFEEEQKRKAEKALKDKTHRKQLKTENAAIEAKLQELESEIPEDLGIPFSFGSSKKR